MKAVLAATFALLLAVSGLQGAAADELDPAMPFDHIVLIVEQDHTYDSYFRDFEPDSAAPRSGLLGLADSYVLFDSYFSSSGGGTLGNMLDLLTGSTHGLLYSSKASLSALSGLNVPTVFDRLNEAGIDWRLYDGGFQSVDGSKVADGSYLQDGAPVPASLYRAPILAMRRTWNDPSLISRVVGQEQLFQDARAGTLPPVSLVLPSPSDSPAQGGNDGEARLLSLVNAIAKSSQWDRTAIFITWDDGGKQFDSQVQPLGDGLRVPLLVVSPYAKRGYISNVRHDHLSLLDLVETRFALEPLTDHPDTSPDFDDAFDVSRGPRTPLLGVGAGIPPTPVGTSAQNLRTVLLYAIGLGGAVFVARVAWLRQRQRAI